MSRLIRKYKKIMAQATSYEMWEEAAFELDYLEGNVEWKETLVSDLYNYELIYDRLMHLREYGDHKEYGQLIRALREGLHHDLGNIGNQLLYNQSHIGTKHLIEEYVNQVCKSLNFICEQDIPELPLAKKLRFFKDIQLSFGRPALLLSGGASLGVFHIGVIKTLWERDLLPQVIAGSSVGSIIAAMLGTHTDDELSAMLDPSRHNMKAWRWLGMVSGLAGKGFMDQDQLAECIRSNVGEYTFEEAYERTGRSINITVSPVKQNQKERLLSGYTSPYLMVWSASLASCAVPLIFPPVKLMKKDAYGHEVPYMSGLRWVDGSVVSDLPIERLRHLYDVNFSIVSQTNPHIVPFLRLHEHQQDVNKLTLKSIPSRILKSELQFHGQGLFDYLRSHSRSEFMRQVSGQMYTILAQRYYGNATIAPQYSFKHYSYLLRNPTPEFVNEMILAGERATWPKLSKIRSHSKISKTLQHCVDSLKNKVNGHKAVLRVIA